LSLTRGQHDALLHVLLTHQEVEKLLRQCAHRGHKDAEEPYVILTGRDRLTGRSLAKRLGAQEFLTLTLSLVEEAGRGAEMRQELEFLAKMLGGRT